jgi:uncharacterized protein (TIGR00304 family)
LLLLAIGLFLIALGLILMLWPERNQERTIHQTDQDVNRKVKGGAVIMIGPIPVLVGSDSKTAMILMLLALCMMIIWVLAANGI